MDFEKYLKLNLDAKLHNSGVLENGGGYPLLNPVALALLLLAAHSDLQQTVVRAGDRVKHVGDSVRSNPTI